ncbi:condensation domain-containing protein [Rhodococcoides corynebacterioides]|uniref:Aureobasidin A1 biosynthesis complex n=1 Tax=Rhodococcoides corynebacterioides TaxID=53972 RepID=A0ABS7P2H9_9NOCA|nr:condensation domain-containing protein [Rhodococcus corynebacterioides]MBY6365874.1 Aureobasidin A1 biosynthesis complex [Rhodococcus corynebacterioides]MBY6409269.1 Aureobasidin A1 biosynthesis complex [Rhodococcus corynebacterioides]
MHFTELADYPLPDGVVTEWTPSVADAAAWRPDARPLAFTHEAHLRHSLDRSRALDTTGPTGNAEWIGAVLEIDRTYDPEAMRRTVQRWIARHEALRTTVDAVGDDLTRRTIDPSAVTAVDRVVGLRSGADVHDHLITYLGRGLSPFRWPHVLIATVSDTGFLHVDRSRFLVVFGADHSVMDAYSMLLSVGEIRRLYDHELDAREHDLPGIGSHLDYSVHDRRTGDDVTADSEAVAVWDRFLRDGPFPAFPLLPAPRHRAEEPTATTRQGALSVSIAAPETTAEFAARCRRSDASLTAGVAAVVALAQRSTDPTPGVDTAGPCRFVMPMHTRYAPEFARAVGWFVGVVPVSVEVDSDHVDTALVTAAESVRAVAGLESWPWSAIAALLGVVDVPRFVVSYLDLRHVPDAASWPAWRVQPLRSATYSDTEVYLWFLRTREGLFLSARFPGTDAATAAVHRFVTRCRSVVEALASGAEIVERSTPIHSARREVRA